MEQSTHQQLEEAISDLESRLAEIKEQMPAHSVPPAMLMRVEELEEKLAELRARLSALSRDDE